MIKAVVDSHNSTSYIISVPNLISESEFLERARVSPNSYAYRLATRLYRDIFMKSMDLKSDYDLYYSIEYNDFTKYLRARHLLRREALDEIAAAYSKDAAIYRYDYPCTFIETELGDKLLKKLLETEAHL